MSNEQAKQAQKIHVFVNRGRVDLTSSEQSARTILAAAGLGEAEYDLYRLQGEGDPSGESWSTPVRRSTCTTANISVRFRKTATLGGLGEHDHDDDKR